VAADGGTILVALNLSAEPATFRPGFAAAGVHGSRLRTLLASPDPIDAAAADGPVTLAPFGTLVASVE
jgi:hypothetical protein